MNNLSGKIKLLVVSAALATVIFIFQCATQADQWTPPGDFWEHPEPSPWAKWRPEPDPWMEFQDFHFGESGWIPYEQSFDNYFHEQHFMYEQRVYVVGVGESIQNTINSIPDLFYTLVIMDKVITESVQFGSASVLIDGQGVTWRPSVNFQACAYVAVSGYPGVTFQDVNFEGLGNSCVYAYASDVSFRDCTMTDGNSIYGGGLHADHCRVILTDTCIALNHAENGGGMYFNACQVFMDSCAVGFNTAYLGGGICLNESEMVAGHSLIGWNVATSQGGGIYGDGSGWTLYDCCVEWNLPE